MVFERGEDVRAQLTSDIQLWALVYNIAALPIAAGVLYPIRHIRLDPVWASLAMALS